MKKIAVLVIFFSVLLSGCEKQELNNQLNGSWKILSVSGGITGSQSIRDFDELQFSRSGKYFVTFNGTVIQGGTYELEKQQYKGYNYRDYDYKMYLTEKFNNHPYANFYAFTPFSITFNNDGTLTLRQVEVSDGFQYDFKRN
jgi:hypothetical protein